MTPAQAILTGSLVIAASILFVETIKPAAAQRQGGPYMIVHGNNVNAQTGVFRLDATLGDITYCWISDSSGGPNLSCTRPTH